MSLPMPSNVKIDIHRTADPSSPYPAGAAAVAGVKAYIQPAATNGRLGSASYLKWSHILYLAPDIDIRDAYNSQLDPARNNNNADTVIVHDTAIADRKTAYYVVFVEVVNRGFRTHHQRVYLDRFAPSSWPTDSV